MSTLAYSQPYTYTSYGVANGGTTYSVPDAAADELSELTAPATALTAGLKFSKFDLTVPVAPSVPADDKGKTFGNNIATPTVTTVTDTDRGWTTLTFPTGGEKEYYSCIRQNVLMGSSVVGAFWAYYTVNFTEAASYNPIVRFREGSTTTLIKENVFTISI